MNANNEILTDRFVLRPLTLDDVTERYLRWLEKDSTKRYIMNVENIGNLNQLRDYVSDKIARDDVFFWGVFLKYTFLHIGNIKYDPVDSSKGYAVMGILIGDPKWIGNGVAPEVIRASANWLFENKCINQIVLGVDQSNLPAISAYKKVGFEKKRTPYISSHGGMVLDLI